jgi:hypothetical protein
VAALACLVTLLLGGCTYLGSDPEPSPDQVSVAWIPPKTISAPIARLGDVQRPKQVRMPALDETATVPGRLSEASAGAPMFDVTVTDFAFAETYYNPLAGTESPPPGNKILFVLVSATNVSQLRGRPPIMVASQGTTKLRGCPIALGDRASYEVLREVFPDETVEGWLCLLVPASAHAQEISLTTGRRDQAMWRLNHVAGASR